MEFTLVLLAGVTIGYFAQGIKVTITHKHEQPKQEKPTYNESLVELLPNEVKQYYHDNSGQNRF
jgi:hypothetical protein